MADYEYITANGVIVPDTSELLTTVNDEFKAALGDDVDVSPETVVGQLIAAEVRARSAVLSNNAQLANQINPDRAGGIFLDAIWRLLGGWRDTATATIVRGVTLQGVPGSPIPEGTQARVGNDGALFELTSAVTLGNDGTTTGIFQSVELGSFPVGIGELNTIVTPVLGLETVVNTEVSDNGTPEEGDMQARRRRRRTLALQGVALPEAITSGVYDVEGVRSLAFRENYTDEPITIENVTLKKHSVYVCVDGGTDTDIARALLNKKSLGANWNGETVVEVLEPISTVTYRVAFQRPEEVQIYAEVTIDRGAPYPDPPQTIRKAIVAYARGEQENERGFTVGGDVSAFELGAAVARVAPRIQITLVRVKRGQDGAWISGEIPITIAEVARINEAQITVKFVDE